MLQYSTYVGFTESKSSRFNGLLSDDTTFTTGIPFPEEKYYERIEITDVDSCTEECKGQAMNETKNWYNMITLSI